MDITLLLGTSWFETITYLDTTQKTFYSVPYIANCILTILFFVGIFILISNFQKSFSGRSKK